jgi:serine/threonine protein kinase
MIDLVGQSLLHYKIESALRAGFSGQVFRARDTQSERDVALKLFKPSADAERMRAALLPLVELKHPNIVETLDVLQTPRGLALVMEYVAGGSLSVLLSRYSQESRQFELPLGLSLLRQAADALVYAHGKGMIHGDIKPDNLLLSIPTATTRLSRAYTLKVGDFSVARIANDSAITQEELVISSPAYMSPEQCQGLPADKRTDMYSFGILMFEVFTGYLPFEVKNIGEAAIKHLYAAPRSPRELRTDMSPELESMILRLLAKNPADRYAAMTEVRDALQGMLERIEPQGPPPTVIRNQADALPAQPVIPDLPDKSDTPRVTVADALGRVVKVVALSNAGIRVGRLDTNEIKLEDDLVSRQHLRVDWNGEQAYITDLGSSNGTLSGGQRIAPHTPTTWSFRASVNVGSYWLRLEGPDTAAKLMVGLALDAASERLTLQAGSAGVLRLTVANLGRLVDHFNFRIEGIPESWVRGPAEAVQLNPGVQTAVMLTVMPPRNSTATAGTREITVIAQSREYPQSTASAKAQLTIEPYAQSSLSLKPLRQSARTKTTYTAQLSNQGNAALNYALYCEEDEPQLGFKFKEGLLTLQPGESRDVGLEVTAPLKILGSTTIKPFRVIARGTTGAVAFPGGAALSGTRASFDPAKAAQQAKDAAQSRAQGMAETAAGQLLNQAGKVVLEGGSLDPMSVVKSAQSGLQRDATAMAQGAIQNAQGGIMKAGQSALTGGRRRAAMAAPMVDESGLLPGSDPQPVTAQLAHGALFPVWLPPAILALLALLFFVLNRPPTITTFEASTLQPFVKTPVPVRFETSDASRLEMQVGANDPLPVPAGAKTFTLPAFTSTTPVKVTLIARGNFGASTQRELTISPQTKQPTITEFRAIPPQLIRGQPVLFRYAVKDAEQVLFDRGDGQPPAPLPKLAGTMRDAPREPRTYKLIAINGDKRVELPLNIAVDVLPPQITGFKIGPTTVIRGQTLTIQLEWKTRNAQVIELTDVGTVPPLNIQILAAPTASKTYTLTARNAKGDSVTRSIPVNVIDPPPVAPPPAPTSPPAVASNPPPTPPAVVAPPPAPTPPPPVVQPAPPPPPVVAVKPPPPPPVAVKPPTPPVVVRPPSPPPAVKPPPPVVAVKPPSPPPATKPPSPPPARPPTNAQTRPPTPPPATPPAVRPATPPVVVVAPPPPPPPTAIGGKLMGEWYHNYGTMRITQLGNRISGSYQNLLTGASTRFTGTLEGNTVRGLSEGQPFTWTINADGTTFEGTNVSGQQWCGAKEGVAFSNGCSFSGSWTSASSGLPNDKRDNCEIKLTRTNDDVSGTYCNGSLEGKIEYRNGQAAFNGTFKSAAGNSSGTVLFVLNDLESRQFTGNAVGARGTAEWCGWRGGRSKPDPCAPK